jgi:hypothetical protein
VSFAAIILCVASEQVFIVVNVYFVIDSVRKLLVTPSCNIFSWKPEGKSPLGRPRRRWEDNIRMTLMLRRWEDVDWIQLAQDRDKWRCSVDTLMNLRVI